MNTQGFDLQVISRGCYVDEPESSVRFMVEVATVRLNHIALNAWTLSECMNVRECYDTEAEWEHHQAEYAVKRARVKTETAIMQAIGVPANHMGSVCVTQAQGEVFTIVHIYKIG